MHTKSEESANIPDSVLDSTESLCAHLPRSGQVAVLGGARKIYVHKFSVEWNETASGWRGIVNMLDLLMWEEVIVRILFIAWDYSEQMNLDVLLFVTLSILIVIIADYTSVVFVLHTWMITLFIYYIMDIGCFDNYTIILLHTTIVNS